MIKVHQVGYVLLWVVIATSVGISQEAAADYVSPSEAVPRGKAPKMQVQLLRRGEQTRQYAVIFYQGDEAFSGLLEFAEKYHITSAHFTAIGALNGATSGWFDPQCKMYKKIPIDGQQEVIGMSGDIALYQGKPVVHTHMVVGSPDGTTRAGHVLAAYVSPTTEDTMRRAIELGINWIDTAAVYGLGHSEKVVGRFVRSLPVSERPYIFTKCGLIWDERSRMEEPKRVLKPQSIRAECEASLSRLGVERIDLYQFHWPDETGTPVEDSWTEMMRLIEEGKVRLGGVSNFNVSLLDRCAAIGHADSLQPPFSLVHRDVAAHEIPWCEAHNTGVICYSPMQSGLLTDRFSSERVACMAHDDWRRRSPDFNHPNLNRNLALRDAPRPIAQQHGTSVSSVAIAWVLSWPGVTAAIVGARSPEQVDGWIDAANLELSLADLDEIAHAIERTGAGSGPSAPNLEFAEREDAT